jgi:hypothetical protein
MIQESLSMPMIRSPKVFAVLKILLKKLLTELDMETPF